MTGFVSGKVLVSRNEKWQANDLFGAALPFSTYQIVSVEGLGKTYMWKLTDIITEEHISLGIGAFGMPGATVFGGL